MRVLVITFLILFAAPAWGDELDDYLNSLPPLPAEVRESFTRAMTSAYDPECRCALFINSKGKIEEWHIPLSDKSMRLGIESIRRGLVTPLIRDSST